MARTNIDEVRQIFSTDLTDGVVAVFIETANEMVNAVLSGTTLSSGLLAQIEKFLAAHLASIALDRQAHSENIAGEYSVTYEGKTGMGLDASYYGQIVQQLDTTGRFLEIAMPVSSLEVFTTPEHSTNQDRL